jgi:hypothetical protein
MSWVDHPELNSVIAYVFLGCEWIFGFFLAVPIISVLSSPIRQSIIFVLTRNWKKWASPDDKLVQRLGARTLGAKNNWSYQHGFYFQFLYILAWLPGWAYFHFVRHYPYWFRPLFVTKALWLYQTAISFVPFVLGFYLFTKVSNFEDKKKLEFIQKRGL